MRSDRTLLPDVGGWLDQDPRLMEDLWTYAAIVDWANEEAENPSIPALPANALSMKDL